MTERPSMHVKRRVIAALSAGLMAMTISTLWSGTAQATPASEASSVAENRTSPTMDPEKVIIPEASAPNSYRFDIPLPKNGDLVALDEARGPSAGVLVQSASGRLLGAFDQAWAQDAAGTPLATTYRIDGDTLVQDVTFTETTVFPVVLDPIYNPIDAAPGNSGQSRTEIDEHGNVVILGYVGVPSNYVYNPSLGSLHDYCTSSPDEFPNPVGSNADFRGPCARHDLCYGGGVISKFTCDNNLYSDMRANCDYWYAWYNPARAACHTTAEIYWAAVVVAN